MADVWKFTVEGVEVPGAGAFKLAGMPPASELQEVGGDLQTAAQAFSSLSKAMVAFETGGAIYRDCLQNVADLQEGLQEGRDALERNYAALGTFFEPGKTPFKAIEPAHRMGFAVALIRELSRRLERPAPESEGPPK